jgi:putative ABC transport system permease protein
MVLGQSVRLLAGGVALGLLASALVSAVLRSQLYGIAPHDPVTFIAASALLVLLALLASYIPAWRAMRVEPMAALRYE